MIAAGFVFAATAALVASAIAVACSSDRRGPPPPAVGLWCMQPSVTSRSSRKESAR